MELRELKTFQKVATLLSFNLAADVLHYAQSTVSAQIKCLEDDLGVPLFHRLGKKITLTEAGENLLKYSQRLLAMAEETYIATTGRGVLEGSLSIRVPQTIATYYLPGILVDFQKRHPKVRLEFRSCTAYRLVHELTTGAIDLSFLMTESILSENLEKELLGFEDLVLVLQTGHPLAQQGIADITCLEGQTLLVPKTDCDYPLRLKKILTEARIKPTAMQEFNSVEAIKQCIRVGLGIALLPRIAVARESEAGELTVYPWPDGPFETAVFMVWHKEKWRTPTLSAFIETVRQTMAER